MPDKMHKIAAQKNSKNKSEQYNYQKTDFQFITLLTKDIWTIYKCFDKVFILACFWQFYVCAVLKV
jgi:hypothetical protein